MNLWNKTLKEINSMEVVTIKGKIYVLVNGEAYIKEFHHNKPFEFFSVKTAQEYINDMQDGIDAYKESIKPRKKAVVR